MPAREELFAAYAVPDRARTRVRMNFVESADGAVTRQRVSDWTVSAEQLKIPL